MFKNMLKRSWLSTTRKVGRTVILALIFFMMASLVLAAIIVKSAVSAQMDYAKSTLGGTVVIQADMEKIRDNQQAEMKAGADRQELFKAMDRAMGPANDGGGMGGGQFGGGGDRTFDTQNDYDISITGINAYAYIDGVERGSMEIKSGTYFDESSENSVMISYELAELNELQVGDEITLTNVDTGTNYVLSIIGVYDSSDGFTDANLVYMNTETAANFLSSDDYNDGNYDVSDVTFYMQNSDLAEEFVAKIESDFPELAENDLKITVDTSQYDAMSESIESVGGFATTILIIVIVAAVIIITLIVTINVKDRRYEMGVLLSLGATKKNIIAQIATELIIVGTIGFLLASVTGNLGGKIMGDSIIASQTATSQQQSEKNFGRPGAQVGGKANFGAGADAGAGAGAGAGAAPEDMPDAPTGSDGNPAGAGVAPETELDINAQPTDFLLLFTIGYLVIILALIVPSISILRYEPKEILAGKE